LRVLHLVASAQRRGAEVFARDLDKALADCGVDQRIALLRENTPSGDVVDFHSPVGFIGGHGAQRGARMKLNILGSLRRQVASWKPDVVQAHGGEPLKYAIPACWGRAPVVYRRIGSTPAWMAGGIRRTGHRAIIRRAARVVAVSEATRAETIRLFRLDPSKVVTVPNGIDLARATPRKLRTSTRAELGIPESAPIVISVGAFTEEKDPLAQVKIAKRVIERHPNVIFLMVGDGPLAARTQDAVTAAALSQSVRLLGPRSDIADLLAASDGLLLASRTEGMPAVVIEAGIVGLAVAAYSLAGVPEVVDDGRTGLLTTPGDVTSLADRVLHLLDDEDARTAMGEAARIKCTKAFDIRTIATRYLRLYEDLTNPSVTSRTSLPGKTAAR
jgi:glycosyltransferase involved in cell wall biosynthesis